LAAFPTGAAFATTVTAAATFKWTAAREELSKEFERGTGHSGCS